MSSPSSTHVPVLIIGGGIVGLSTSLSLSHHGSHSLLVERHSKTSIHPPARSVNARTMEMYRGVGSSDAVREAGTSLSPANGIHSGSSMKEVIGAKPRKERNGLSHSQICSRKRLLKAVRRVLWMWLSLSYFKAQWVDARIYAECLSVEQDEERFITTLKDSSSDKTYQVTAELFNSSRWRKLPHTRNSWNRETRQRRVRKLAEHSFQHQTVPKVLRQRPRFLPVRNPPSRRGRSSHLNQQCGALGFPANLHSLQRRET